MPSDFVNRLKSYEEAINEEFAKDVTDVAAVKELTTKLFVEEIPGLAKQLRYIAQHAEKESDQLAAIKFAFEFIFGKSAPSKNAGGTLEDLISQLTANDPNAD